MQLQVILLCILVASLAPHRSEALPKWFSIQNRIAGGDPAEEGQFPFQVGVQTTRLFDDGREYSAWCGGSLISDEFVVTAAHCVIGGISADIFLGTARLRTENQLIIKVGKADMIIHEKYYKNDNDIALIRLKDKVPINERIQTVNLPRKSQKDMTFEKNVGWISGWGRLGDKKGTTDQLQFTRRWILPNAYCNNQFPGYFRGDIQVCVDGSHGKSSCSGDSGGPLTIVEENNTRTLVGLASYGATVCERGYATVYTRITPYLEWISEKTGVKIRD